MKSIVIYNSETGFTKRYALWIAGELGCEAVAYREAKSREFSAYDTLIFGSWCHAGTIRELAWLKTLMKKEREKRYVVFAVGASPAESPEIDRAMERNFPKEWKGICKAFYCPGGLNYAKMGKRNRAMMRLFARAMAMKRNKTRDEEIMAEMIAGDYDISDPKYITPIIEYINGK